METRSDYASIKYQVAERSWPADRRFRTSRRFTCRLPSQLSLGRSQICRNADRLTVGMVQREIKVGMPSSGVAEVLGSPNIVSTDEHGREVWIYDKTATEVVVSGSSWLVTAGASSKSQRTLTVIVKFDQYGAVRDIAYHSSQF